MEESSGEHDADEPFLDGADLCIGCLTPIRPGSDLCLNCGAPHGGLAGILPLPRVLAEGYVYRQAVQRPRSLMSVIGIWVIFGAHVLTGLLIIPLASHLLNGGWHGLLYLCGAYAWPIFTAAVGVCGIAQSTNNFLALGRKTGGGNQS